MSECRSDNRVGVPSSERVAYNLAWRNATPENREKYRAGRRRTERTYYTPEKRRAKYERAKAKFAPTEALYWARLRPAIKAKFGTEVRVSKIHPDAFSESGVSDVLLCLKGRYVAIELKRKPYKPTPLQEAFLADVKAAGGIARVVWTHEPVEEIIEWLLSVSFK